MDRESRDAELLLRICLQLWQGCTRESDPWLGQRPGMPRRQRNIGLRQSCAPSCLMLLPYFASSGLKDAERAYDAAQEAWPDECYIEPYGKGFLLKGELLYWPDPGQGPPQQD